MTRHFLAYKITNTVNGKGYIGITTQRLQRRWRAHILAARAGKPYPICCAIRKYGEPAFTIELVAECSTAAELCDAETRLIREHGTLGPSGYNATLGGEIGGGHRRPLSPVEVARVAPARWRIAEWLGTDGRVIVDGVEYASARECAGRLAVSVPLVRYWLAVKRSRVLKTPVTVDGASYESIAQASRATGLTRTVLSLLVHKSQPGTELISPSHDVAAAVHHARADWRRRCASPRPRQPVSEETLQRLRAANVGRIVSPESRERMRVAHLGKVLPASQRAKQSAANGGGPLTVDGVAYPSMSDASRTLGVSRDILRRLVRRAGARAVRLGEP